MPITDKTQTHVAAVIRHLDDRRRRAMTDADIDTLAKLLDDAVSYTHSNAARETKAEYLNGVADGTYIYGPISDNERQMIIGPDAVLVISEIQVEALVAGKPRRIHNLGLAVWLRRGREWRLAAYQPTPLPTPPLGT
jgi:hypothetical protein